MRELRHISKKQVKKQSWNRGVVIASVLLVIVILAGAFAFLRTKGERVSADISPGNIYTDKMEEKQQVGEEDEENSLEESSEEEETVKSEDFTFYKVLNSKEGDIIPLNVKPSKPAPDRELYSGSLQDEKTEKIDKFDSDIVKKIESKEKEGIIYTVQIGALRHEKAANDLAGNLRANGFAPYISSENSSGGFPVYKVRIGKFLSMVDAQEVAAVLKREGYATYILKIYVNE